MDYTLFIDKEDAKLLCSDNYKKHGHKCTVQWSEVPWLKVAEMNNYEIRIRYARTASSPTWVYQILRWRTTIKQEECSSYEEAFTNAIEECRKEIAKNEEDN